MKKEVDTTTFVHKIYSPEVIDRGKEKSFKKVSQMKLHGIMWAILAMGLGGIIVGVYQISKNIQRPFSSLALKESNASQGDAFESAATQIQNTFDIDGDGISDDEEKNIYFTSPYLEDSDSDGKTDFQEIEAGTDPNCVLGERCFRTSPTPELSENQQVSPIEASSQNTVNAQFLRSFLKQSNIDPSLYETLSDEELFNEYLNVKNNAQNSPKGPLGAGVNIEQTSPAELRKFLEQNGMSKEIIEQFSDQELLQVLEESKRK